RLSDLVRQGGGELAYDGRARDVRELAGPLCGAWFGISHLGDLGYGPGDARRVARREVKRRRSVAEPPGVAIAVQQPEVGRAAVAAAERAFRTGPPGHRTTARAY